LAIQQTERSRLSNVNAIVGLFFGSVAGLGLLLNGAIASRILQYKVPDKWKEHEGKSSYRRITKVVGSSFAICFIPSARVKAQEKYNLNFLGAKRGSVSLEMNSLAQSHGGTVPLLLDDNRN
jgi:hypothetical protein